YRSAAAIAQTLPAPAGMGLAKFAGKVAPYAMRSRARMATKHQQRLAAPGATEADIVRGVRGVFDSYARYWYEIFRLPVDVRHDVIVEHFTIENYDLIEAGLERGKGVVLALPHLGGWEWAAAWMAAAPRNHRMLAVVEALEPPELLEWFARQREAMGL